MEVATFLFLYLYDLILKEKQNAHFQAHYFIVELLLERVSLWEMSLFDYSKINYSL